MFRSKVAPVDGGYVLAFTILLILGVTAIAIGTLTNAKYNGLTARNYGHKIQTFNAADGMMTLLAQEAINGGAKKYIDTTRYGKIYGKVWISVSGTSVKSLKDRIASQPIPNYTDSSYYLGSNKNLDNYGIKWSGWILPPISGSYTFYVMSDDAGSFYLSPTDTSTDLPTAPICSIATWTSSWPVSGSGVSQSIPLESGKRYYFEFFHKEGSGGDIGMVGWDGPEWFSERPIATYHISRYQTDPAYAYIDTIGNIPVRYRIASMGLDQFGLFTEAVILKPGTTTDTAFRSVLSQALSIRGKPVQPPDTVSMPVIYYDYRANGSNPEFESPYAPYDVINPRIDTMKNMVANRLTNFTATNASYFGRSDIPKPSRCTGQPYCQTYRSCNVGLWFQSNTSVTRSQMPRYRNTGTPVPAVTGQAWWTQFNWGVLNDCSTPPSTAPLPYTVNYAGTNFTYTSDAFDNQVILDSIKFAREPSLGPNTYVFSRRGNFAAYKYDLGTNTMLPNAATSMKGESEFFPINGRGFGHDIPVARDNSTKNYGFCAEMHSTFQHSAGLRFQFVGDDDVWVFVNDSLVMDLGGVHWPVSDVVYFDDLPLRYGNTYNFDFFFCERRSWNSSMRIETNLPVVRPQGTPVTSWRRDYGSAD